MGHKIQRWFDLLAVLLRRNFPAPRLAVIAGDLPDTKIYLAAGDGSNPVRLTR